MLLQEVHSEPSVEKCWQNEWGGKIVYSHGTSQARGVMTLFNRKFACKLLSIDAGDDGRWCSVSFDYEGNLYTMFNIYAPNKDQPNFFSQIENKIAKFGK